MKTLIILLTVFMIGLFSGCDDKIIQPSSHTNTAPIITISTPTSGQIFGFGENISFTGNGLDEEDGILHSDSLIWSSDKDGFIGLGSNIAVQNLTINQHVIILCGTDTDGKYGCDTTSISIIDTPEPLLITSEALPTGFICAPYRFVLTSQGGIAPYTWSLETGSTLPSGITLTANGTIMGVLESMGTYDFTVVCTDAAGTPHTATTNLTLDMDVPANPSLAIYFDEGATVCKTETMAFSALDCHVFIMLEDSEVDCSFGTEFMINICDVNGNALGVGTQYTHSYVSFPQTVSVTTGDPFSGIAIAFDREQYASFGLIHVASFGLLLFENFENLSFQILPSPTQEGDRPIITSCDEIHSVIEVTGRASAINYSSFD